MALGAPPTWAPPDETATTRYASARGLTHRVELQAWYDMRMRGQWQPARLPMHKHPFTLVRCVLYGPDDQPVFRQTLWLAVLGPRRRELTLVASWQAYRERFDLEMVFTQMTKGCVLARGCRWDHVTDFHRIVVDDDSVNQQLYQLSALGEVELLERRLQAPTEVFNADREPGRVQLLLGLRLQLA
jgi:hypothetical protein